MGLHSFLAKEICKDIHPNEVYELAEEFLSQKLMNSSLEELKEEYEERYDYVFEELQ
jgi:hypothetical protein